VVSNAAPMRNRAGVGPTSPSTASNRSARPHQASAPAPPALPRRPCPAGPAPPAPRPARPATGHRNGRTSTPHLAGHSDGNAPNSQGPGGIRIRALRRVMASGLLEPCAATSGTHFTLRGRRRSNAPSLPDRDLQGRAGRAGQGIRRAAVDITVGYVRGSFSVSAMLFGRGVVKVVLFAAGVHSLRWSCPYFFAAGSSEIPCLFLGGCAELIPVGPAGVVLSLPARDVFVGVRGGAFPGGPSRNGDPGIGRRFPACSGRSPSPRPAHTRIRPARARPAQARPAWARPARA